MTLPDSLNDAIHSAAQQVKRRADSLLADWRDRMPGNVADYADDIRDEIARAFVELVPTPPSDAAVRAAIELLRDRPLDRSDADAIRREVAIGTLIRYAEARGADKA